MRPRHSKKDLESVLQKAEAKGFEVVHPWGHWGALKCPGDCQLLAVFGTPKSAQNHAKSLKRQIDRCPHIEQGETK